MLNFWVPNVRRGAEARKVAELLFPLSGCQVERLRGVQVGPTTYLLREGRDLKNVVPVSWTWEVRRPGDRTEGSVVVLVDQHAVADARASKKPAFPPFRTLDATSSLELLGALYLVASYALPNSAPFADDRETPILWVVGSDPVIIAESPRRTRPRHGIRAWMTEDNVEMTGNLELVSEKDLNETVVALHYLPSWPQDREKFDWDKPTYREAQTELKKNCKTIALPRGTTLAAVMRHGLEIERMKRSNP